MNFFVAKLKNDRTRSIILMAIAAVLWSTGGLMLKSLPLNPLAAAGSRSLIAALLMLAIIKKPSLKFNRYKLGSAIAYTGTMVLYIAANHITTAANAIMLQYTAPIYVALLSAWFLNERTTALDWIATLMTVGGMFLFFMGDLSAGAMTGNIYAMLSGVFYAFTVMLLRKQKDGSTLELVFWGNLLTAIVGLPFLYGSVLDARSIIILFLLGFQIGFPYILYSYAIKHVSALEAILIPVLEPILNPVWVFLFIGEAPSPWAFAGGFIVLTAIVGRSVIITLKKNISRKNA
jgi:drug/metabolite transporter (DMT)-like permease